MTDKTAKILKGVRFHRETGRLILLDNQIINPFAHQWVTEEVHIYEPERRLGRYYILVLDEREVAFAPLGGELHFVDTFVRFFCRFWPEKQGG